MGMLQQAVLVVLLAASCLIALMLVIVVLRLARLRWQRTHCHPVMREDVPAFSRAILDLPAQQLAELGFVYRYSGSARKALVSARDEPLFFDVYQHSDGHNHAMVSLAPVPDPHQPCMIQLVTSLADGNNWTTLNRCRHYSPMTMPHWQVFDDYLPQWVQAWQAHQQRVQVLPLPDLCSDGIEIKRRLDQAFEELIPQMLRQGQLVPIANSRHYRLTWLTAFRFAAIALVGQWRAAWATRGLPPATPAAASADGLAADLQAFEDQLALRRAATSSGKSKLLMFVVSAALFLVVGGWWFSWSFVPVLLAVIALHEGGHYLAMRLTGYRNVSVFFLPGLGGLATGEKATATPMEKLFVYLAGPVPGIVMAGAAFWASSAGHWLAPGWLNEFLIASLAINYLNLLPITPLDGGRVLETFAFARHPRLRFGFAALCCGLLLAGGIALDDLVLKVFAVLVAIGLSHQWHLMRLDLAVARDDANGVDEPQALRRIFAALQMAQFQAWSFGRRTAVATALLPELMGRRPRRREALVGLLIYAGCLIGPIAAALVAVPQLGAVLPYMASGLTMAADDVDPEPAEPPAAQAVNWNARLAQAANLSREDLLQAYLGAGQEANGVEDRDTAERHFRSAWDIAKDLPLRDLRRIDALEGLAAATESDQEQHDSLTRIVAELVQPQGAERVRVAAAKEQLSYGDLPAPERVALLRDAVALRATAMPTSDHSLSYTRLALAHALDANADSAGAEAVLQTRIDSLPLPAAGDRSRKGLQNALARVLSRIDLAWFLIDHGRATDAIPVAALALQSLPPKVTTSWTGPHQQVLEVMVWAHLLASPTPALAVHWDAYDQALRNRFAGGRKLLFHEADRALVAQALQDANLQASAKKGVQEAMSTMAQRPAMLCQPPQATQRPNWRRLQQDGRRRILTELGVCGPA